MYNNLKLNKMKRITLLEAMEKGKPLFQTTYNILIQILSDEKKHQLYWCRYQSITFKIK